jgi:cytidylate kinase
MSRAIIRRFRSDSAFAAVSKVATKDILARDAEDGQKLQQGIDLAISKQVVPSDIKVEPVTKIVVTGKTAAQVSAEIVGGLNKAYESGCVMTLQGLSGTGKGTTVAMLKAQLPNATTWSNGNIFRSLTLLAATRLEQMQAADKQKKYVLADALTPELLAEYVGMLSFGKYKGKFDVRIKGLGYDMLVSEVCNTTLKSPKVSRNIPTVAGVTQGEVINFVQDALKKMAADGVNVLLEGREQTLNYIRTPHRFELVLDDVNVIGMRRAAQRMGAEALKKLQQQGSTSDNDVASALKSALESMAQEE